MKKNSFYFIAAILASLIAFSCGSDNEDINVPTEKSKSKITFNVSAFTAEESPISSGKSLRLSEEDVRTFLQYIVYKEDGTVYKDNNEELNKVIDIHGQDIKDQKITMQLPEGKYKIAFVRGRYLDPFIYGIDCPVNFHTDFCAGNIDFNPNGRRPNNNNELYYEWIDQTVLPAVDVEKSIILQPMWSNLSIKINDIETCILPSNTAKTALSIDNYTYGFNVEDKQPKNEGYLGGSGKGAYKWPDVTIDIFRQGLGFQKLLIAENSKTFLVLSFYDNADKLLGSVKLYEGSLARGKNITISGSLGDLSNLDPEKTSSLNYTLSLGVLVDQNYNFLGK